MSTPTALPTLAHHVFFWLKNPQSSEDLAKLLAGLHKLAKIEAVRAIHIGIPAAVEPRAVVDSSYSASEILLFDSIEAQDVYQNHPLHQQFIAECGHLWDRVIVYDATLV